MVMLMDAGNSRVKWAWLESDELGQVNSVDYSLAYNQQDEQDQKHHLVTRLLLDLKPEKLLMVHVLGIDFEQAIKQICDKNQIELECVPSSKSFHGVINGYDNPQQLGADRFVAIIAAHYIYPDEDCIVIDAGTAVTIDAITAKGVHLGGLILPGLQLFADSLIKNTQLQHTSLQNDAQVFATNTRMGIHSGSIYGLTGAIGHVCVTMWQVIKLNEKNNEESANSIKLLLCGGDSLLLAKYLTKKHTEELPEIKYELVPDLVMHGLMIIEKKNRDT